MKGVRVMAGKTEARVVHRFAASADRVFDAWLDPKVVETWMRKALQKMGLPGDVRRIEIAPEVGGKFTFSDMRPEGEAVHWGTYLEIERPAKLVFTWFTAEKDETEDISVVTLTVKPDGKGCIAAIVHELEPKWAEFVPETEQGWRIMLEQIEQLLTAVKA